jgi:cysteine desulfurase
MSTNRRIYLDYNATAPVCPAARTAITDVLGRVGNPSSIHAEGRAMRDLVERARGAVAALVERPREQIVFTSGGTEANQLGVLALATSAERRGLPRVVASAAIDHPSLRGAVAALVRRGWTCGEPEAAGLLAIGLVNHELGTVLDPEVIARARRAGALIHVDAVQAVGKRALELDADAIAISGHKLGAPQGVGALAIALDEALPLLDAGHQERGRRPGTENTLGIVGLGAAAAAVEVAAWWRVAALGGRLEAGLRALGARIHGEGAPRIGGTVNAAFPGVRGDAIVIALDLAGVSVSTGAACTSGAVQPSAVLLALGQPPEVAREAVRFSLGTATTEDEIDEVLRRLPAIVERARAFA